MSYLHNRLRLFERPAFAWYTLSCFLATFGSGLSYIAIAWMIVQIDSSVSGLVILMACFWIPNVILGPFVGVIADRFERKWVLFFSNITRVIVLFVFAGIYGNHYTCSALDGLALLLGVFFSVYAPAAMAFIREIIPEDELLYANASVDIAYEVGNVAGMGAAGLVIAATSYMDTLYINGSLLLLSALILLLIKQRWLHFKSETRIAKLRVVQDMKEGLSYIYSNKKILIIYTLQLLVMCQYMTAPILLVPFAKNILHTDVISFGHIETALSVAVVFGGFSVPWLADRIGVMKTVLLLTVLSTAAFLWFGFNRNLFIAEMLYFVIGLGFAIWPVILTIGQDITDLNYQGRVQACFNSVSGLIILLTYVLVSLTSHLALLKHLYFIEVALCLLTVAVAWVYRSILGLRH
ncbi:MAG: MFS transporter [Gammaproteobacteria bacterium]|nr:MFS transporter [Gammaproteobacteria bacterium]MCH9744394.1 MFS transporter [Gammaproteobacteria bacterium]